MIVVVARVGEIFTAVTDLRSGLCGIPLSFCCLSDTNTCEQGKLLERSSFCFLRVIWRYPFSSLSVECNFGIYR
jgi:hypothetical protein